MSLPTINSFRDVAKELSALADRIKDLLAKHNFAVGDARHVALSNWLGFTYVVAGHANALGHGETGARSEAELRSWYGITGPLQEFADAAEKYLRLSYLVLTLFQIENMFANVLRELGAKKTKGYFKICTELVNTVQALQLADRDTLMVSAHQRNSLHANGIHDGFNKSDTKTTVRGVPFEFLSGKHVNCAGWPHIIVALNGVLDVVGQLLASPDIAGLPQPVHDEYASLVGGP